jgi:hypothetical protein
MDDAEDLSPSPLPACFFKQDVEGLTKIWYAAFPGMLASKPAEEDDSGIRCKKQ